MGLKRRHAPVTKISARVDPEQLHLLCRHRSHPMEARDGKRRDKICTPLRSDHAKPVRLTVIRGELGDELAVRNASRGGKPCLLADPAPDLLGDRACASK